MLAGRPRVREARRHAHAGELARERHGGLDVLAVEVAVGGAADVSKLCLEIGSCEGAWRHMGDVRLALDGAFESLRAVDAERNAEARVDGLR